MEKFGLHSTRVLIGDELVDATIIIQDGQIESIETGILDESDCSIEDVGNSVIMPGLIDCHVHINEPGREEWEGFDTATKAAAAGGITTLIEMPLNASPVTTTREAFEVKLKAAEGKLHVNCGFWGGIVPQNIGDIDELIEGGVFGIKAFLTHSGIDDFPNVSKEDLRRALPIIKKHNVPLLVHAELDSALSSQNLLEEFPISYQAYLASRPKSWEDNAIEMLIELCKEFDTPIHVVHLSSAHSILQLENAKREGVSITVETCPHYMVFEAEGIEDGQTQFKCAPPIREKKNNELLLKALKDDLFSFIVSDHSPAPPEMKEMESGNFMKAWGGIAGLQYSFPAFWTKAKENHIRFHNVSKLMSQNVAKFLNIEDRKGRIAKGLDADLVVWNPDETMVVTNESIQFKHKITPYEGMKLNGRIEKTYVGGHKVYDNGLFCNLSRGKILKRS